MRYLKIKNWEKFQHYKDRSPPWIKMHRELLDDYDFSRLQDASKAHLMLIWMLGSQLDNRIPDDAEWVAKKIGAAGKVDLKVLIENKFLVYEDGASKSLAGCSPEAEAYREETEKKVNPPSDGPDLNSALEDWNAVCGDVLPKVRKLSDAREKKLLARLKDLSGGIGWKAYLELIRGSPFLCGDNNRGWKADLDFALNEGKMNKILEGSYSRGKQNNNPSKTDRAKAALRRSSAALGFAGEPEGTEAVDESNLSVFSSFEAIREGAGGSGKHQWPISVCSRGLPNTEDRERNGVLSALEHGDAGPG